MDKNKLDTYARLIDHTDLHANATHQDIIRLCQEAKDYHFKMVAINQVQSQLCHQQLKDTDIHVGAAISFPLGQTSIAAKVAETRDALQQGADEIDYVINLTEAKAHNWDYLENEMGQLVALCRQEGAIIKVIFENAYLTEDEKIQLCKIAKRVKPDFIKTSTGFAPTGATVSDVRLMAAHVGDQVKVKAAGGIRDAATFLAMIEAGAQRIGTSSGIKIIEELRGQ